LQITRHTSINETQFLGCTTAFVDALNFAMHSAMMFLEKLEAGPKGSAFAFEIQLDSHRYGALLVLERWADFIHAFGPHVRLSRRQSIIDEATARVQAAENLLGRANQLIDSTEMYSQEIVAACAIAFRTVEQTFGEERAAAEEAARLGPMLAPEFHEYRRIFAADLAAR
jgi:hypothetical protein